MSTNPNPAAQIQAEIDAAVAAQKHADEPAPIQPKVGQVVGLVFIDGAHNVYRRMGFVLSIGAADEKTGQPVLSVVYPDPAALPQTLGSTQWHQGFLRATGVQHESHPDVQSWALPIGWGGSLRIGSHGTIPAPAGDGTRSYFKRYDLPKPLDVSPQQAAAAQSGTVPEGTVISPLVNEAPPEDPKAEAPGAE
jgi:hypothetical protein